MNLSNDQLMLLATLISAFGTIISAIAAMFATLISAIAAIAAGIGLYRSAQEQKTNVKEDFILWAIERLRKKGLREARGKIYAMTDNELKDAIQSACKEEKTPILDAIREVSLAFDEIGYFVYKMEVVSFRDILDMYTQTVKIWNRVAPIIEAWRIIEGPTSFVYFEMLARQERLKAEPRFPEATKLFGK